MIAVGGDEHLRLVAQPAEGDGVDDPVAVALELGARSARARAVGGELPPAAGSRVGGVRGAVDAKLGQAG
jgi:hypothetical protein